MKKFVTLFTTLLLIFALGSTAFAATGTWKHNTKGWWYQNEDGSYPAGKWSRIDGKWYHFDENGYMQTGWLTDDGSWYYLGTNGEMKTGWQKISSKWYYLGTNGIMKTGWQKISSKWYYLGTNGVMKTGWQKISSKWYYLGTDGAMKTGWQKISSKWYYLGTDGVMKTGWQKISNKWYYLNSDGTMKTGWLKSGGKWYYLKSSGVMAANETVNGYTFDKNGVWVKDTGTWENISDDNIFKGAKVSAVNSEGLKLSDFHLQEDKMIMEDGAAQRYCNITATWENNTKYYYNMICTFSAFDIICSDENIAEAKEMYPKMWKEHMTGEGMNPPPITNYFGGGFPIDDELLNADKVYVVFLNLDKEMNYLAHTIVTIDLP